MLRATLVPAILSLLAAASSGTDEAPGLIAHAPGFVLDGPVVPLAAPLEIATVGWGPFRRLCVEFSYSNGMPPSAEPCLIVTEARESDGIWTLSVQSSRPGRPPEYSLVTTRDGNGRFGAVEIVPPPTQRMTPRQLMAVSEVLRDNLQSHALPRGIVTPGMPFTVPVPLSIRVLGISVADGGFVCDAEGVSSIGGRQVLVAACVARGSRHAAGSPPLRATMAGRFAIDVETGLILRHGYAYLATVEGEVRGTRAMSRQSLE